MFKSNKIMLLCWCDAYPIIHTQGKGRCMHGKASKQQEYDVIVDYCRECEQIELEELNDELSTYDYQSQ